MSTGIYYFVDEKGNNPVKDFIKFLPIRDRAKAFAYLGELEKQGHNLRRPVADYLRDGIYELRPKHNRIFYFFFLKDSAVLLHAIRKRTDKIPEKDLDLCLKRKAQIENYIRVGKLEL